MLQATLICAKIKMMRYKSAFSVSRRCVAYQLATKGQNITAEREQLDRDFCANPDEKRTFSQERTGPTCEQLASEMPR